jgi:hypothetical protein
MYRVCQAADKETYVALVPAALRATDVGSVMFFGAVLFPRPIKGAGVPLRRGWDNPDGAGGPRSSPQAEGAE